MGLWTFARRLVPAPIKRYLRDRHRQHVLRQALARVAAAAPDEPLPADLARDLVYGWGNEGWSAGAEFIQALAGEARVANGPMLECGSGLSTLLLGVIAAASGQRVFSLEHHPEWAEKVRGHLSLLGIASVEVLTAPLQSFGHYSWYGLREDRLPPDISLVVCDGPPGETAGGRYGLLPRVRSHLRPGCVVLLDDADRPAEQVILEKWKNEYGLSFTLLGNEKPFARITIE